MKLTGLKGAANTTFLLDFLQEDMRISNSVLGASCPPLVSNVYSNVWSRESPFARRAMFIATGAAASRPSSEGPCRICDTADLRTHCPPGGGRLAKFPFLDVRTILSRTSKSLRWCRTALFNDTTYNQGSRCETL